MLVLADARTEVVAKFVVAAAEAFGCAEALELAHTSDAAFYAAVILLKPVAPVSAGAVSYLLAQC
nr:hypothetical protein [Pseudoroseomonas wenyumeiae]